MNIRKRLIEGLILAFALAGWQMIGQPFYNEWLQSSGHNVGIFENAIGYVCVIFGTWFVSGFFTRHMDKDEN